MNLKYVAADTVRVCKPGQGDWPTSSNVCCFHCCHTFTGPPIPWVGSYDDRRATFRVGGPMFCSWRCMKTYGFNMNQSKDCSAAVLFRKLYNKPLNCVPTAPAREWLIDFGGRFDIRQFRSHDGKTGVMPIRLPSGLLAVPCVGHVGALRVLYKREISTALTPAPTLPTPSTAAQPQSAPKQQPDPSDKTPKTGTRAATGNHNILQLLMKKPKPNA